MVRLLDKVDIRILQVKKIHLKNPYISNLTKIISNVYRMNLPMGEIFLANVVNENLVSSYCPKTCECLLCHIPMCNLIEVTWKFYGPLQNSKNFLLKFKFLLKVLKQQLFPHLILKYKF